MNFSCIVEELQKRAWPCGRLVLQRCSMSLNLHSPDIASDRLATDHGRLSAPPCAGARRGSGRSGSRTSMGARLWNRKQGAAARSREGSAPRACGRCA